MTEDIKKTINSDWHYTLSILRELLSGIEDEYLIKEITQIKEKLENKNKNYTQAEN